VKRSAASAVIAVHPFENVMRSPGAYRWAMTAAV